jgi:hypothetical protein
MSIALYVLIRIHKKAETAKQAMLEGYYKEQTTLVSSMTSFVAVLTGRYRNSILSFHSAMTGLTRQGTRASMDEKTPLAKGMSRSSSSASSEGIVRRHERWGKH